MLSKDLDGGATDADDRASDPVGPVQSTSIDMYIRKLLVR